MPTGKVVGLVPRNSRGFIFLALAEEGDYWTIPGGKVEKGETPEQALIREMGEEFPGLQVTNLELYRVFQGFTPHSRRPVEVYVYFGDVSGSTLPSAEIKGSCWTAIPGNLRLSSITQEIVGALINHGHL